MSASIQESTKPQNTHQPFQQGDKVYVVSALLSFVLQPPYLVVVRTYVPVFVEIESVDSEGNVHISGKAVVQAEVGGGFKKSFAPSELYDSWSACSSKCSDEKYTNVTFG